VSGAPRTTRPSSHASAARSLSSSTDGPRSRAGRPRSPRWYPQSGKRTLRTRPAHEARAITDMHPGRQVRTQEEHQRAGHWQERDVLVDCGHGERDCVREDQRAWGLRCRSDEWGLERVFLGPAVRGRAPSVVLLVCRVFRGLRLERERSVCLRDQASRTGRATLLHATGLGASDFRCTTSESL